MNRDAWITGVGLVAAEDEGAPLDDDRLATLLEGLPEKHLRHADRAGRLAVAAARAAVADAGFPGPCHDVGLALGVDYGTYPANFAYQRRVIAEGARFASPAEFTLTLPNMTTAFVSILLGVRGPTATVADGGVAGGTALGMALDWIRAGVADHVLAGAVEPFDAATDDLLDIPELRRVPSRPEHAALWLLEAPAAARARGASPRAVLSGYAATSCPADCRALALVDAGVAGPCSDAHATTDLWRLSTDLAGLDTRVVAGWSGPPSQQRAVVLEPAA